MSLAFALLAGGDVEREIVGFPPGSLPYRAELVGSTTCASCHPEHSRTYQTHPMALTGRAVTEKNYELWFSEERLKKPVVWNAGDPPRYRPDEEGVVLESGIARARAGAILGSGARGFTPIGAEPHRSIRELRLSFSSPHDAWLMTPGSERDRDPLGRAESVEQARDCLGCHSTLLAWRDDVVDFQESTLGIQCERCHGPGSAHVESVQAGNPSAIFNPGALPPDQQAAFCGQCHRQPFDVDPLSVMSRHPSIARHAGAGLMLSECFRRSPREATITCLDCHDPHDMARDTTDRFRAACLRCHSSPEKDHRSQPVASSSDCVSCHLRVEERGLQRTGFTDHWIRAPGAPAPIDSFESGEYLEYLEDAYRRGSERPGLGPEKKAQLGVGLAEVQFARQSHEASFQTLETALSFAPGYTERLRAAALYRQAGLVPEAVDVLQKAIASEPERFEAYSQQGELFQQLGKPYDAAARYRRALELDPSSATAHNSLGSVLGSLGRLDEALLHFERALELNSSYLEARGNLGLALQQLGRLDEARAPLEEALEGKPEWPVVQNALARILATHPDAARRNPTEAVRLADRAAELTRYENPAILDTLAAAYASAGNFEKAVTVAEEAIRRVPAGPLAEQIRSRLNLYRDKKPYVEAPRD